MSRPATSIPTLDGPVLIAANQDSVFRRLVTVMGQPELADDPRYATHEARGVSADALDELIGAWTAAQPAAELLALLHENGIPAGLIYRAADMLDDPHFQARQAIIRLAHPEFGELPMQNVFPRLSGTPGTVQSLGPALGQHNGEVYGELLKLTAAELAELTTAGVI